MSGRTRVVIGLVAALLARIAFALDPPAVPRGGVLLVGTTGDYAPFSVAQGGRFAGFDIDLVTRLAQDLGVRIEYVQFRWPDFLAAMRDDRFDIAVSGVTVRPERAVVGRYTRPYALTGAEVLIRRADRARFPGRATIDRAGVHIVVNRGGYLEQLAHQLFRYATVEAVADNRSLPERVLAGTADGALTDGIEARTWARAELATVGPLSRDRKAILVRAEAPQLAQWIDTWLRQRERDGWLRGLRQRWFGDTMFAAAAADREAVLTDIELRCRLMPAVAAAKVAQGLPFEDREQEQRVLDRVQQRARAVGSDPDEMARLFASLIRAAKAIQVASATDPHADAPPLASLRSTLADLDAHLIRQLHDATRTVKPAEWRAGVREGVSAAGLSEPFKADIAGSLAHIHTLITPAAQLPTAQATTPALPGAQ